MPPFITAVMGGRETYYGLRAPKTASSGGRRPGVPEGARAAERGGQGFCGAQWTRSSMPCGGHRLSMFLCRRWLRTSQTPCCGSWIFPIAESRLSKCPRSLALRVHRVLVFLSRSQRNSWWEVPTVLSPTRIAVQDRGADRRHSSSSWWWPAACSRFSP